MEIHQRTIADSAQAVIEEEKSNAWGTTKMALIKAFEDHRPYEDIIQQVRDTPYQESSSKFVNELKSQIIKSTYQIKQTD